jgi:hypothetical protein
MHSARIPVSQLARPFEAGARETPRLTPAHGRRRFVQGGLVRAAEAAPLMAQRAARGDADRLETRCTPQADVDVEEAIDASVRRLRAAGRSQRMRAPIVQSLSGRGTTRKRIDRVATRADVRVTRVEPAYAAGDTVEE